MIKKSYIVSIIVIVSFLGISATWVISKANESINPIKTILIEFYSGKDKIEDSTHTNGQLTLRGWNHYATRSGVSEIGV